LSTYASPGDDAKQVLLGFNEKVSHLENSRFYQRYKNEPPNLLMFMDQIDKVESRVHESEPCVTLNVQGFMRFSVENFDREEIEAFVLTYRILTQQNDRYSVRRLVDVYKSTWVEEDGRRAFEEAREEINEILESSTKMDFGDGAVSVRLLVDVLVYGALAHSDASKERQYKAWTENPTMAAAAWIEFMGALLAVMRIFRHMRDVNSTLLYNVFRVALPEHLLPLVERTLEIACLRPRDVEAEDSTFFQRIVLDAGEVNPETLAGLYQRARSVSVARLDGQWAAVGALKRPYSRHRAKIFKQARSEIDPKHFPYELGWFHVLNGFRGHHISSYMVEALMQHADGAPVYATSRVNNVAMHSALTAHGGFVREGSEYSSEVGKVPLCLFIRAGQVK
jgi:hypothetical protein